MSGNNLFGNQDDQQQQQAEVTPEQAMEQLVGEGKKYGTPEELAKALLHSQQHIQTLETENANFRTKVEQSKGVEDVLAALQSQQQQVQDPSQQQPPEQQQQQQQQQEQPNIDELVQQGIDARFKQQQEQANVDKVTQALSQKLGAQAAQAYQAKGNELGLNLDELAKQSPDAVIALVAGGQTNTPTQQRLPQGQQPSAVQGQGHQLSKKEIQKRYDAGQISLTEKHSLESKGYDLLGKDEFFK